MRKVVTIAVFGVAICIALLAVVFSQSYQGRQAVIQALRENCERSAQNNAALINDARARVTGDLVVASDRGQPWKTRHARSREAMAEQAAIAVLLSHLDVGHVGLLSERADRRTARADGFRCSVAFPAANPITG